VLAVLSERYPGALDGRYGDLGATPDPEVLLQRIGQRRGCLVRGGEIDLTKAAAIVLGELREGRIGRVTLELPSDSPGEQPDQRNEE
jgi:ribosome biogenesis GTPase A